MNRRRFLMLAGSVASISLLNAADHSLAAAPNTGGLQRTQTIADAANRFLALLDDEKRAKVNFPYIRQQAATAAHFKGGLRGDVVFTGEQYGSAMWSNFPVSDVPRPGVRLGDLDEGQRDAAMALLRVLLSERGYSKMLDIMGSDQALAKSGTPYASGRAVYTLAIFGAPSVNKLWMVQFGGHHLALNITMLAGDGVLAPVLTGALPASYTDNGTKKRALAQENDKAFALLATLTKEQREQVMIDHPVSDLVLGPGHDGETVQPVGIKASMLSEQQRAALFDLICEWANIVNDIYAAPRLVEIKEGLSDTWFAWSGPVTRDPDRNGASYFRIQGPKLFIEFSPQEPGGDLTMHVHSIYRDPANAYGKALA